MKFRDGISIIVTVYNKEQFISKTLETISKQMSGNSQLIIINDGSTDKSELVIKKFIKSQNKDIKYIKQKNAGPSKAVNSAFKFVKYTYLKFVDGDDIIAPDALFYMKKETQIKTCLILFVYVFRILMIIVFVNLLKIFVMTHKYLLEKRQRQL